MRNFVTTILIFTLDETLNVTFILCFIIMPKDQVPILYERIVQLYFLRCIYQQQDERFRNETWLGETPEVLVNHEHASALTVVLFSNEKLLYALTRTIEVHTFLSDLSGKYFFLSCIFGITKPVTSTVIGSSSNSPSF